MNLIVIRAIAAAVVTLGTFASGSGAQDMNTAIDKAVQKYATINTARGTIHQVNRSALRGDTFNLTAAFQQQNPNLLSVRYSDPKGDVVVADGKYTWFYLPSINASTVRRSATGGAGAGVNLLGVFLDSPRTKYTLADSGRVTIDGHVTRAVSLVPKQPMAEFRRAMVWIEESTGIIWQFQVNEPSGGVKRFTFKTLQLNTPVDAAEFRFTPPRGVKVVDGH